MFNPSIIRRIEKTFIVRTLFVQGCDIYTKDLTGMAFGVAQYEPDMAFPNESAPF